MTPEQLRVLKWKLKHGPKLTREGRAEYLKLLLRESGTGQTYAYENCQPNIANGSCNRA